MKIEFSSIEYFRNYTISIIDTCYFMYLKHSFEKNTRLVYSFQITTTLIKHL